MPPRLPGKHTSTATTTASFGSSNSSSGGGSSSSSQSSGALTVPSIPGLEVREHRHPHLTPAEERQLALQQLSERLGGAAAAAAMMQAAASSGASGSGPSPPAVPHWDEDEDEDVGSGIDWRVKDPEGYGLAAASSYGWSRSDEPTA